MLFRCFVFTASTITFVGNKVQMKKILIFIIILLVAVLTATIKQKDYSLEKWKIAMNNVKAYSNMVDSTIKENIALQLTAIQLKSYNDSILNKLNNTRKELKIKDKRLKALQYISSSFSKEDTIVIKDTIFKEPSFNTDTVLADKWYQLRLGLKYPSSIVVKPEFKSEKHIVVSTKKETVNPPKKFFLFRLFQRKHTIVNVDVVEKNPYVKNEKTRYIEVIK